MPLRLISRWPAAYGFAVGGSLLCAGCPNPNRYTTPRTVEPGQISHSVSLERGGWYAAADGASPKSREGYPTFPSYQLRVGAARRLEFGAHFLNGGSIGFDFKYNFYRSSTLDAAIEPAFQWFRVQELRDDPVDDSVDGIADVTHYHAPLLFGLNLSEVVSIVASPGLTYSAASDDPNVSNNWNAINATEGFFARLGLGLNIRVVSRRFSVHPEVTALRTLEGRSTALYMAGLGFNFGRLPDFADSGDDGSTEAP